VPPLPLSNPTPSLLTHATHNNPLDRLFLNNSHGHQAPFSRRVNPSGASLQQPVACSKGRQRLFCAATTNSKDNSSVPASSSGRSQAQARQPSELDPATQFSSLANAFSRRVALGTVGASIVAIGGNLGGITSLLLGFEPQISRDLKLDAVYPVQGYKRCIDTSNGFGVG
jgi:hypothetical protein